MSELSFGEAENWVDYVERQIGYKFVNLGREFSSFNFNS